MAAVWGWLAIVVMFAAALAYLSRVFYSKGYARGKEETDEIWSKKVLNLHARITNPTDDGIRVSDGNLWKSTGTDPGERLVQPDETTKG